MGKRFKPRYIFDANKEVALGITGIREDDFLRILTLCEEVFGTKFPDESRVTGVGQHRSEQAETIAALRNGGYTVNSKGDVTVKFDIYNPNKNQPLRLQRVKSVLTSASLRWADQFDPDNYIRVRLDHMKMPARSARHSTGSDKGTVPLSKDDQRLYYIHLVLGASLNDSYAEFQTRWNGARRGSFGRVVDMSEAEAKSRKSEMDKRLEWKRETDKMFASIIK